MPDSIISVTGGGRLVTAAESSAAPEPNTLPQTEATPPTAPTPQENES